jgi:hypothetical protein
MAITTIQEVKFAGGFTSEYDDAEILTEIDIVEADLYTQYYLPKKAQFSVDLDYTEFYISEDPVHEIKRVQVAVETTVDPSGYSIVEEGSDTWTFISGTNYITLGSDFVNTYVNKIVRVQYIPKMMNRLATNIVAANLLDITTIVDGERITTPQGTKLLNKIQRYRDMLRPKTLVRSSLYSDYDPYDFDSPDQSRLRNIVR